MSRATVYDRLSEHASSYEAAARYIGDRDGRDIGYATEVVRRGRGRIAVRHHATDIVTLYRDGTAKVDCDSYRSSTTKRRVNACLRFSGWQVFQRQFAWYLAHRGPQGTWTECPYHDGLVVHVSEPVAA